MKEDLVLIQLQELSLSRVTSIEIVVHLIYDWQYLFCFKKRVRDHVSHSECYVFDRLFTYAIFISSIEKWFLFVFSLFCIRNNQLFTFCLESLNRDESDSLINFQNQSFEIEVLSRLDVASRWRIITFFFFISFCKCVWTAFNVVCVTFNLMLIAFNSTLILLTSFNIWIMSLWVSISMLCCWHMYLIKITRSSASWVLIQAFSFVLMLILIISWSKNNALMFSSSIFDDAFVSSSSDAVWFCDRSDSLSASWVS